MKDGRITLHRDIEDTMPEESDIEYWEEYYGYNDSIVINVFEIGGES
jgi:hypothetical protein